MLQGFSTSQLIALFVPKALAENLTAKEKADADSKKEAAAVKAQEKAEAEAKAKAEAESAAARAKLEDDALAAWESNADLREQHANDFDAYLAAVLEQAAV